MNDQIYDIALSFDESLTPIEKVALFQKFGSSQAILELKKGMLTSILGRRWTGNRFKVEEFINQAKNIAPYINKAGIGILRFDDPQYPSGLKMIPDYPFLLYYRGRIDFAYEKALAVVGTRNPDEDGLQRTRYYTESLVKRGFTIISGLAHGIDTSAHYHCLEAKGITLAVLGCGIDKIYPFANKEIARRILDNNGGIISEYPPGTIPKKWNFPKRNRIIVGLSRGVLITQSPGRSGSLISAELALDYNRDLFVADPGSGNNPNDLGNRELILRGAIRLKSANQIIQEWMYCKNY